MTATPELGVLLYHAAPLTRHNDTGPARAEGGDALVNIVEASDLDAHLVAADWNHDRDTIDRLVATTDGRLYGTALDGIVAHGLNVIDARYVRQIGDVRLGTDHPDGALRVTVRRADRRLARTRVVWLYNVRVGRNNTIVDREIRAMLGHRGTFLVLLTEATGYTLPRVPTHQLIRDRSTGSRANLAAYLRRGHLVDVGFADLRATWRATERPGRHDPRTILAVRVSWDRRK